MLAREGEKDKEKDEDFEKSERFYFIVFYLAFQKKYTTRNQWLSYIYNTVPEQYNANSREYTDICRYFNYLLILSHLLNTGRAFREKCKLHTAYNNQEIFVFELVHLKVDILNFL